MQTKIVRHGFDFGLPVPGRIGLAVKLVKIFAFPKRTFTDTKVFFGAINRQSIRRIGLELNGVSASIFRSTNKFHGVLKSLAVVGRHFGDYVSRPTQTNL